MAERSSLECASWLAPAQPKLAVPVKEEEKAAALPRETLANSSKFPLLIKITAISKP
jgi:hypothetical protein